MRNSLAFLLLLISIAVFSGCAAERRFVKAKPTSFLNLPGVDRTGKLSNLPFQHSWVADGVDGKKYSKVVVAPVTAQYVPAEDWEKSISIEINDPATYRKEVKNLAAYTTNKLIASFHTAPENRFQVVRTPGPGTVIMEMALTEVIFGNPVAAAGAMASPVAGTSTMLSAVADPSVAYEVRFRDGVTGKVLATAADRNASTPRVLNLNTLTSTSACRDIVEDSAELLVQAMNKGRFGEVNKSYFTLNPW